jgi:hypothetical protein
MGDKHQEDIHQHCNTLQHLFKSAIKTIKTLKIPQFALAGLQTTEE